MEDIISIPSRIIPWKKIFINSGLSVAGLTGAGVLTTAKLANEQVLDAKDAYEKQVLDLDTKHIQQIKEKDKEIKILQQHTPSAQKARLQAIQDSVYHNEHFYEMFGNHPELYRRRGRDKINWVRSVYKLCKTTNPKYILDPKIAQFCRIINK